MSQAGGNFLAKSFVSQCVQRFRRISIVKYTHNCLSGLFNFCCLSVHVLQFFIRANWRSLRGQKKESEGQPGDLKAI